MERNWCLSNKVYVWIMEVWCKSSEVKWMLRRLVASRFYRRAWVIHVALEERTNHWPSRSKLPLHFIKVIAQPHLPLNQSGPRRSQIFADLFLAIVASDLQNSQGIVRCQQTHTHVENVYKNKLERGEGVNSSLKT